jgi:hypothetical protein
LQRRFAREEKVKEYHLGELTYYLAHESKCLLTRKCEKEPISCLRISTTVIKVSTRFRRSAKIKTCALWPALMKRRSSLCTQLAAWPNDMVSQSQCFTPSADCDQNSGFGADVELCVSASQWEELRKAAAYEHDYFFVSQLFENNWQPRTTI